jgi:hypothetical protein
MKPGVVVWGLFGLGDHLVTHGIVRSLTEKFKIIVIPAIDHNYISVKSMFSDDKKIHVFKYPKLRWEMYVRDHIAYLEKKGFESIALGSVGANFFINHQVRLDELFYEQAGYPLTYRWEKFYYPRDFQRENLLFEKLNLRNKEYIFLHEDKSRGFEIDRAKLPKGLEIVEPKKSRTFSFFDYRQVIENSYQVHCIESSFSAFIENCKVSVPKFAHRYSRPEAKNDYRYEYTYISDWEILH